MAEPYYPVVLSSDFNADRAARFVAKARAWEKAYRAKKAGILEQADAIRTRIGMVKKMSDALRKALAAYREAQEAAPALTYTENMMQPEPGNYPIPVRAIMRGIHTPENTSFREQWHFEVEDIAAIPKEHWIIDQKHLDDIAATMKDQTDIPGGRAVKRLIPVVRAEKTT